MKPDVNTRRTPNHLLKTIVATGMLAGFLDALTATVNFRIRTGKSTETLFRYIASGVWGNAAFSGSIAMAVWGVVFHFIIALSFTALFFLLYPRLKLGSINKFVTAAASGLFVWLIMNLVVVPLTPITQGPFTVRGTITGMLILMVMIGLPLSLVAHRYFRDPVKKANPV